MQHSGKFTLLKKRKTLFTEEFCGSKTFLDTNNGYVSCITSVENLKHSYIKLHAKSISKELTKRGLHADIPTSRQSDMGLKLSEWQHLMFYQTSRRPTVPFKKCFFTQNILH